MSMTPLEQSVLNMVKVCGIYQLRKDYEWKIHQLLELRVYNEIAEWSGKLAILEEISERYEVVPVSSNGFMCEPCGASGFQLYERPKK